MLETMVYKSQEVISSRKVPQRQMPAKAKATVVPWDLLLDSVHWAESCLMPSTSSEVYIWSVKFPASIIYLSNPKLLCCQVVFTKTREMMLPVAWELHWSVCQLEVFLFFSFFFVNKWDDESLLHYLSWWCKFRRSRIRLVSNTS